MLLYQENNYNNLMVNIVKMVTRQEKVLCGFTNQIHQITVQSLTVKFLNCPGLFEHAEVMFININLSPNVV